MQGAVPDVIDALESSTVVLDDPPSLAALRAPYPQPAARAAASVQKGDLFTGDTFAYGSLLSGQMRWWVDGATQGRGTYAVGANEEAAVATALTRLRQAGRADFRRYAVVRSPSNFDQEYPGQTALAGLEQASGGGQPESRPSAWAGSGSRSGTRAHGGVRRSYSSTSVSPRRRRAPRARRCRLGSRCPERADLPS